MTSEGMDRDLSPELIRKYRLKKFFPLITVILSLGIVLIFFRWILSPSVKSSRIAVAVVERGNLDESITASGIVIPEYETVLTSPLDTEVEAVYHQPGDTVDKGESILFLNKESLQSEYDQLHDELEMLKNKQTQLRLSFQKTLNDLETELSIKDLRIEFFDSKLAMEKELDKIGASTRESLELAELELKIARLQREQLATQIQNQKEIQKSELKELKLQVQIQQNRLQETERQLKLAATEADRAGVVTFVNDDIGSNVRKGEIIARIADLNSFKIEASISDIHAAKIKNGIPVKVRIEQTDLPGLVTNIKPTIERGVVTFYVDLKDKSHPALRSNLRVDVFVILTSKENTLRVKNGPFMTGSGAQDVFILKGDHANRHSVIIGAANFDYVEILEGAEVGDEIIISNTERYIHHKKIKIKHK